MQPRVDGQWAKIDRACAALNGRWTSHSSGALSIGQIAVACALAYVDFRHCEPDWRTGNTALADWFGAFGARDSALASRPPSG